MADPASKYSFRFTNIVGEPTDGITVFPITAGAAVTIPLINRTNAAVAWSFNYDSQGLSALNISLQSAPSSDNQQNPGTFATFAGTTVAGSNPATATTSATYTATGYYPFIRISLNSSTGTGSINITLNGWKSPTFVSATGGSSTTIPNTANLLIGGAANTAGDSSIVPSTVVLNNQANTLTSLLSDNNGFRITNNSAGIYTNAFAVNNVSGYQFSSTALYTGVVDVGLWRSAAGVIEVNNGAIGSFRDLKVRHALAAGTTPTITSGFGTSPSITGSDEAFSITIGTGGVATTGVITFATAYTGSGVVATVNDNTTLISTRATPTLTTVTLTSATPWSAGDVIGVLCKGY